MNVKPGDLAITVAHKPTRTATRNSGRVVEVLRFIGVYEYSDGVVEQAVWCVRVLGGPLRDSFGQHWSGEVFIDDKNLRPIRDPGDSATDETLVFAGKPQSREVV